MTASLSELQSAIQAAADLPLARARTLPAGAYLSPELFAWEEEHLFRAGWQCVAHVSQLPRPGNYLALDLGGEPLVVTHGKDGVIRVLSRACPHRGMDILAPGCGHERLLLCPYHAWTFELDGRLKACPEMHLAEGFVREEYGLAPFRSELWRGFVLVNLDGRAEPLAPRLGEMDRDLAAFRLESLQVVVAREWDCPFDWKVLVENFMESYHHLGIHHRTLQPMMPARDTWTEQERRDYVRAHLPYRASAREEYREFERRGDFGEAPAPLDGLGPEQKAEWGLFLLPPTFLLATAPDRVIWYRLRPHGAGHLKLLTTCLVSAETAARPDFEKIRPKIEQSLVDFHLEDMTVCVAVQKGMRSSGWRPGQLSHLEMPVWLFHRYLAARIRGAWPTEDRPPAPSQRP